jgi:CRP-like cAMP-binding protein
VELLHQNPGNLEGVKQMSECKSVDFSSVLGDMGVLVCVKRGKTIYYPGTLGTSVYLVESGRVKIEYLNESGKKLILAILNAGEIFGEMCLVGEECRRHLATAIEETVVRRISKETLLEAINTRLVDIQVLLQHFAHRMRKYEEALEDIAFHDIQARLSRQLLKLSDEYGVKTKEGTLIAFQLTHKDLAEMIGSARENTTLALNRFAREGILDKSRYRIVITDMEKLINNCPSLD